MSNNPSFFPGIETSQGAKIGKIALIVLSIVSKLHKEGIDDNSFGGALYMMGNCVVSGFIGEIVGYNIEHYGHFVVEIILSGLTADHYDQL
jgi:hypothetical protein